MEMRVVVGALLSIGRIAARDERNLLTVWWGSARAWVRADRCQTAL